MNGLEWPYAWGGACLIGLVAWRFRLLTGRGAMGAIILGGLTMACGGWAWLPPLMVAFVVSSLLGKLPPRPPSDGPRNLGQVAANGSLAGFLCLSQWAWPEGPWFALFVTAWAGLAADTWATEIGSRWGGQPRSLINLKTMDAGDSGGVSPLGFGASLAGSTTVALSAWSLADAGYAQLIPFIIAGGVMGALIDSLLGATGQARFQCQVCTQPCETLRHCGHKTEIKSGIKWLRNDLVNWLGIASGVATCWVLLQICG